MQPLPRSFPSLVALATLASGGCLDDAEELDELGATEQDLSFIQTFSWGSNTTDLDLGSATGKTCFLTGIHGSLKAFPGTNGTPYTTASAGVVLRADNHWWVHTQPGNGPGVSAQGICINRVANRVFVGTSSENGFFPSVPRTDKRRCFLTEVRARGHGWYAYQTIPPHNPPGVQIAEEGPNWVFRSWLIENSNGESPGGATAVCVDVTLNSAFNSIAGTAVLTSQLFPNGAGIGCGLSGLFGVFDHNWNQPGAEIFIDSSGGWSVQLAPLMQIKTPCVQ
jgi:hypothetical protein